MLICDPMEPFEPVTLSDSVFFSSFKGFVSDSFRPGRYIDIVSYRDTRRDIVTDFRYCYRDMAWVLSFPGWKGLITVKCCVFWNLPDCFHCFFIYLYPFIHITDDYSSKNGIGFICCEITSCHPYSTVSVSRYLFNGDITHSITIAAPAPLRKHNSQPT